MPCPCMAHSMLRQCAGTIAAVANIIIDRYEAVGCRDNVLAGAEKDGGMRAACAELCQRYAIDGHVEDVAAIVKQVDIGLCQPGVCIQCATGCDCRVRLAAGG